jgi:hypothetical protein
MSTPQRRIDDAKKLRDDLGKNDHQTPPAANKRNEDAKNFPDHCGVYSKGLIHGPFGRVDGASLKSMEDAIASGKFADYEAIKTAPGGLLNGPQGALRFNLEGLDESQFGDPPVPPAPQLGDGTHGNDSARNGNQNALELLEHYWASLLRDVAFTDYTTNPIAKAAATEISKFAKQHPGSYQGPVDASGSVTPELLFRGGSPNGKLFQGETAGPYISQFLLIPGMFGQYPISQQYLRYTSRDFVASDFATWVTVQNGGKDPAPIDYVKDASGTPVPLFLSDGRALASWTRVDVLYQAYFTALLVLQSIGGPLNPGNPYVKAMSKSEKPFGTFGGPDFAAALAEVSSRALDTVWYQKWNVHLRPRPEAIGGLVDLVKTGQGNQTDCKFPQWFLNSDGLKASHAQYSTWLLAQAFPEGSPTHPSYPTGHGTVGGACITVLKFFFDGSQKLVDILAKSPDARTPKVPQVPLADGSKTVDYTAADASKLTVNGELNKLGHNISFGHGIHAGIHWRSDTDTSLLLGEAVALNFLKEHARTYNEPFKVEIQKFDGTIETIMNA